MQYIFFQTDIINFHAKNQIVSAIVLDFIEQGIHFCRQDLKHGIKFVN